MNWRIDVSRDQILRREEGQGSVQFVDQYSTIREVMINIPLMNILIIIGYT